MTERKHAETVDSHIVVASRAAETTPSKLPLQNQILFAQEAPTYFALVVSLVFFRGQGTANGFIDSIFHYTKELVSSVRAEAKEF